MEKGHDPTPSWAGGRKKPGYSRPGIKSADRWIDSILREIAEEKKSARGGAQKPSSGH